MSTIYELTEDIKMFMDMMEEDPESEAVRDTLEALSGELDLKAESYCKVIRELEGKAALFEAEITRLQGMKSSGEKNIDRLKKALLASMIQTGKEKIKGDLFSLSIRNNAVSLDQVPDKLPKKYMVKQDPKVDRRTLLEDIKLGVSVKGVTTKQTRSLIIK